MPNLAVLKNWKFAEIAGESVAVPIGVEFDSKRRDYQLLPNVSRGRVNFE